ncbi:MAG TPA: type II secretion system protein [Verrucomicrobiota bacterium]|nr:type II secretion system protein [Verrucomicrobiota bacterium]
MNTNIQFSTVRRRRAFTLPEIIIVLAIFSMLSIALVSSQLFGLRLHKVTQTKLSATADGRKALNRVREDIREGKIVLVGNGGASAFRPVTNGAPQIGNALQIHPTTNLNVFTRYYLDFDEGNLMSVTSDDPEPQVIARYITNQFVFQAEDFQGNVLTNDENNRVVRMILEFYQWEYPVADIGPGGMYDYYRLQTRVTRRLIE